MRKLWISINLTLGAVTLGSLTLWVSLIATPGYAGEVVDRIVATVGSEIILESDVRSFAPNKTTANRLVRLSPPPAFKTPDALEALIYRRLLEAEVRRVAPEVTDQDLARAVATILQQNKMSREELERELRSKGTSIEQYKKQLTEEIQRLRFIGQVIYPRIQVTERELNQHLSKGATEEERFLARQKVLESKAGEELTKYLNEVKTKTYISIVH